MAEIRNVKIDNGYGAHVAQAFTPKSVTKEQVTGVVADVSNRGTSYVPKGAGDSKAGKD